MKIVAGTTFENGQRQIDLRVLIDKKIQGAVAAHDPRFSKVCPMDRPLSGKESVFYVFLL